MSPSSWSRMWQWTIHVPGSSNVIAMSWYPPGPDGRGVLPGLPIDRGPVARQDPEVRAVDVHRVRDRVHPAVPEPDHVGAAEFDGEPLSLGIGLPVDRPHHAATHPHAAAHPHGGAEIHHEVRLPGEEARLQRDRCGGDEGRLSGGGVGGRVVDRDDHPGITVTRDRQPLILAPGDGQFDVVALRRGDGEVPRGVRLGQWHAVGVSDADLDGERQPLGTCRGRVDQSQFVELAGADRDGRDVCAAAAVDRVDVTDDLHVAGVAVHQPVVQHEDLITVVAAVGLLPHDQRRVHSEVHLVAHRPLVGVVPVGAGLVDGELVVVGCPGFDEDRRAVLVVGHVQAVPVDVRGLLRQVGGRQADGVALVDDDAAGPRHSRSGRQPPCTGSGGSPLPPTPCWSS